MAKMFYTLEEVAEKLGKSEDDVREMASTGQIQEFRDRDKLMFKVDQIDLLAGDEETGEVHLELEDTAGGSGLGLSGGDTGGDLDMGLTSSSSSPGMAMTDSREGTGISVFDTDHGGGEEEEDPGEGTKVGDAYSDDDLSLDEVGSGSGLLDLTRESDDTSLGAELLEEVYAGEDNIEIPSNASGLFEAASAEAVPDEAVAAAGIAAMPIMVESYDGAGSGLTIGLAIGALASMVCVAIMVIVGVTGTTPDLAMKIAASMWMWVGGLAGVTLVFALIGWFIGKSSE